MESDKQEGRPSIILDRPSPIRGKYTPPKPDFEVVLTPFKRLRQFKNAKVIIPEPLKGAGEIKEQLEMLLTEESPWATYFDSDDLLNDLEIERDFQNLKFQIERESETLPGGIADTARGDRN